MLWPYLSCECLWLIYERRERVSKQVKKLQKQREDIFIYYTATVRNNTDGGSGSGEKCVFIYILKYISIFFCQCFFIYNVKVRYK